MGIYEKTRKKRIAGVHIRIRVLQSQSLAPRVFRRRPGRSLLTPIRGTVFIMLFLPGDKIYRYLKPVSCRGKRKKGNLPGNKMMVQKSDRDGLIPYNTKNYGIS
jgi:hypothetical protein